MPPLRVMQKFRTFKVLQNRPFKRILSDCNIKVALKLYLTLDHIFAKAYRSYTKKSETHAVYSIPCSDCEKEYLGQWPNASSTLSKGKSALAEHLCGKHVIAWKNSKIITTNNRSGQRRCLEAWHINMNHHALTR